MDLIDEIDSLLDAIDTEISYLTQVRTDLTSELDSEATHDMATWSQTWSELPPMELPKKS